MTELWTLMEHCWDQSPQLRPDVSEVLAVLRGVTPTGPLIPNLNVLVGEPTSFPAPTMKPVDLPPIDVYEFNFSEKELVIPRAFVQNEEPFFRYLDLERELGDLDVERDFGQRSNPEPYTKFDTAVAPQPTPAEPGVTGDVEPVPEP